MKIRAISAALVFALNVPLAIAGEADVVDVSVDGAGTDFRFSVTVKHADEGWDHYADRWEVLDMSGNILGTRVLAHPHVQEQPFTRSATISIPQGIASVVIRAHDNVDGYGGAEMKIDLPGR